MSRLGCFNVVTDNNMVERVKKTWKEHICLRFWETYKIVPMKTFIVMNEKNTIICHPSMKLAIEEQIEGLI